MSVFALFIGINKYKSPQVRDLGCAVRDAKALHALFADNFESKSLTCLTDHEATSEAIRSGIAQIITNAKGDDLVIITFSGHGSDNFYIATHEAEPSSLATTCIAIDELVELFSKLQTTRALLVLDCCFSGDAGAKVLHSEVTTRSLESLEAKLQKIRGDGRIIITASTAEQAALESQSHKHGYLTYYLLEALEGAVEVVKNQMIPVLSLYQYVAQKVSDSARQYNHEQNPCMRGKTDSELHLPVLARGIHFNKEFPDRVKTRVSDDIASLTSYHIPQEVIEIWQSKIGKLNKLQVSAINDYGLLDGNHLVVSAPTSSGKTMVAEIAAISSYFNSGKSVFLLPLKALVNDKYAEFLSKYEEYGLRIIKATGDYSDQIADFMKGKYDIALLTYEKFTSLLLANPNVLHGMGLVVVDEAQMLSDKGRGQNLEFLLTLLKVRRSEGIEPQLVLLSAVIGDTNGLERWLNAGLLVSRERPVPLKEGIITGDGNYKYIDTDSSEKVEQRFITPYRDKNSDQDVIKPLVAKLVADGEKVIVFKTIRAETVATARYLANVLQTPPATDVISALPQGDQSASTKALIECLGKGVAFHNSNLEPSERLVIEEAFRASDSPLRVIVATTTLAMGINTPASTVIISGLEHPGNPPTPYAVAEYKNMVGRAGRLGFSETGKAFVVARESAKQHKFWRTYVTGQPESLNSSFKNGSLLTLITRVLATLPRNHTTGMARSDIAAFLHNSFAAFEHNPNRYQWSDAAIDSAITNLENHDLITPINGNCLLTEKGRLCGEAGIEADSVVRLIDAFRGVVYDRITDVDLITATQVTLELDEIYFPFHSKSHQERDRWIRELIEHGVNDQVRTALDRRVEDTQATLRRKKAVSTIRWYKGDDLASLEAHLQQHYMEKNVSGQIRAVASRTKDLLPTTARLVELLSGGTVSLASRVEDIMLRLELGVPPNMLSLAKIVGAILSRADYLMLFRQGKTTKESLADKQEIEALFNSTGKASSLYSRLEKVSDS